MAGGRSCASPITGAWQQNAEITVPSTLSYAAVFACTTLIAQDIGKLPLRLVEQDDDGIWTETYSPAFSPVLAKPNRYQIAPKFLEQWMVSKLTFGNTYVLKQRDDRGVVVALYVLDPTKVRPLVTPDGAVYYELHTQELAGVEVQVTVPAREIIHDLMVPLFHPLVGVSPIYACGQIALQGLSIQQNSTIVFRERLEPGRRAAGAGRDPGREGAEARAVVDGEIHRGQCRQGGDPDRRVDVSTAERQRRRCAAD